MVIELPPSSQPLLTPEKLNEIASTPDKSKLDGPRPPKALLKRYQDFLIPALILFLIGNALALALPDLAFAKPVIGLPFCVILVGLVIGSLSEPRLRWAIQLNLWLIALIAGSMHYQARHFVPGLNDISQQAPLYQAQMMGTTIQAPDNKNRVIIRIKQLNGQPGEGLIQAYLPSSKESVGLSSAELEAGTRILLVGNLEKPHTAQLPGNFNQAAYLQQLGVSAILKRTSRIILLDASNEFPYPMLRLADHLKNKIARSFAQALPSPHAEVLAGLVLGDKAVPVPKDTKQAFIETGLVHVLAASGLNVGIIAGAVLWLLSKLKFISYRKRLLTAMSIVGLYCLMTGLPPSIQRAGLMLEVALGLKLFNRQLSPLFLLCLASTLLLLMNPDTIGSTGFQFSVLTTFGLMTMVAPLQDALGFYVTRWLAGLILVPLIAQLWVWPLSIAYFNQFPLHTIPLNIIALGLVAPLTLIGFTASLFSLVNAGLGGLVAMVGMPLVHVLLGTVQWGQSMRWAQAQLASPAPWQIFMMYLTLLSWSVLIHHFSHLQKRIRWFLAVIPLLVLIAGTVIAQVFSHNQTQISLLPLSYKQQAVLIQPAKTSGQILLLPTPIHFFEARALNEFFRHRQVHRLAAVVLLSDVAPADSDSSNALALKDVHIQTLIYPTAMQDAQRSFQADQMLAMPQQGASLSLGRFQLASQPKGWALIENQHCLLRVDESASWSQPCALNMLKIGSQTRLFAEEKPLESNRFYQLAATSSQLKLTSWP